jgi:hypothetical protein
VGCALIFRPGIADKEDSMSGSTSLLEARLAVLVGAPHMGDVSMHNDIAFMYDALRQRGLAPQEIICLEGQLDRSLLLGLFAALSRRTAHWTRGQVLLYVSGHGYFDDGSGSRVRVGMELQETDDLSDEYHVLWDELFRTLALPAPVQLILLPDQ